MLAYKEPEYDLRNIPEVVAGKAVMAQVEDIGEEIDALNEKYFADTPYHLVIYGNFTPRDPYYTFEIGTKATNGYCFPIFTKQFDKKEAPTALARIETLLEKKELGKTVLHSFGDNTLARNNYIRMIQG